MDREVLFPCSSMSQNRGFTRGFVANARFLILMIYTKKIGTKRLCRNSEVITIQRCCNWEVALYFTGILINVNKVRPSQHSAHHLLELDLTPLN